MMDVASFKLYSITLCKKCLDISKKQYKVRLSLSSGIDLLPSFLGIVFFKKDILDAKQDRLKNIEEENSRVM